MKRFIAIIVIALGIAAVANAQPKAIGIRGSFGGELSYQQYMGGSNFLEMDLGFWNHSAYLAGLYNFNLYNEGGFGIYAGPGASVGFWAGHESYTGLDLAVLGQAGIEYNFNIPLNISLDWRPSFHLNDFGFSGSGFALGIRYKF